MDPNLFTALQHIVLGTVLIAVIVWQKHHGAS